VPGKQIEVEDMVATAVGIDQQLLFVIADRAALLDLQLLLRVEVKGVPGLIVRLVQRRFLERGAHLLVEPNVADWWRYLPRKSSTCVSDQIVLCPLLSELPISQRKPRLANIPLSKGRAVLVLQSGLPNVKQLAKVSTFGEFRPGQVPAAWTASRGAAAWPGRGIAIIVTGP